MSYQMSGKISKRKGMKLRKGVSDAKQGLWVDKAWEINAKRKLKGKDVKF